MLCRRCLSGCQKKGGLSLKGGSLHDGFGGFDGLGGLESTLPSMPPFGGKKVYTKGVFSSENSSASPGAKKEVWRIPKRLFSRGKRRKMHIHQRAFKVFVGNPFAQYWCIDFGLLTLSYKKNRKTGQTGNRDGFDGFGYNV